MDEQALILVKARLGISTNVRDSYLQEIVKGVIAELTEEKGLSLKSDSSYHLMFIVDYVTWRYQNRDNSGAMPRHLQFRLHNLMVHEHVGGDNNGTN